MELEWMQNTAFPELECEVTTVGPTGTASVSTLLFNGAGAQNNSDEMLYLGDSVQTVYSRIARRLKVPVADLYLWTREPDLSAADALAPVKVKPGATEEEAQNARTRQELQLHTLVGNFYQDRLMPMETYPQLSREVVDIFSFLHRAHIYLSNNDEPLLPFQRARAWQRKSMSPSEVAIDPGNLLEDHGDFNSNNSKFQFSDTVAKHCQFLRGGKLFAFHCGRPTDLQKQLYFDEHKNVAGEEQMDVRNQQAAQAVLDRYFQIQSFACKYRAYNPLQKQKSLKQLFSEMHLPQTSRSTFQFMTLHQRKGFEPLVRFPTQVRDIYGVKIPEASVEFPKNNLLKNVDGKDEACIRFISTFVDSASFQETYNVGKDVPRAFSNITTVVSLNSSFDLSIDISFGGSNVTLPLVDALATHFFSLAIACINDTYARGESEFDAALLPFPGLSQSGGLVTAERLSFSVQLGDLENTTMQSLRDTIPFLTKENSAVSKGGTKMLECTGMSISQMLVAVSEVVGQFGKKRIPDGARAPSSDGQDDVRSDSRSVESSPPASSAERTWSDRESEPEPEPEPPRGEPEPEANPFGFINADLFNFEGGAKPDGEGERPDHWRTKKFFQDHNELEYTKSAQGNKRPFFMSDEEFRSVENNHYVETDLTSPSYVREEDKDQYPSMMYQYLTNPKVHISCPAFLCLKGEGSGEPDRPLTLQQVRDGECRNQWEEKLRDVEPKYPENLESMSEADRNRALDAYIKAFDPKTPNQRGLYALYKFGEGHRPYPTFVKSNAKKHKTTNTIEGYCMPTCNVSRAQGDAKRIRECLDPALQEERRSRKPAEASVPKQDVANARDTLVDTYEIKKEGPETYRLHTITNLIANALYATKIRGISSEGSFAAFRSKSASFLSTVEDALRRDVKLKFLDDPNLSAGTIDLKEILLSTITTVDFASAFNGALIPIFMFPGTHSPDQETRLFEDAIQNGDRFVLFQVERSKAPNLTDNMKNSVITFAKDVLISFDNFKNELRTNPFIGHRFLWEFISAPNERIFPLGCNLVILKTNPEETYSDTQIESLKVVCPTEQSFHSTFDSEKPTLILYSDKNLYHAIYWCKITALTFPEFDVNQGVGFQFREMTLKSLFSKEDETQIPNISKSLSAFERALKVCSGEKPRQPSARTQVPLSLNQLERLTNRFQNRVLIANLESTIIGIRIVEQGAYAILPCKAMVFNEVANQKLFDIFSRDVIRVEDIGNHKFMDFITLAMFLNKLVPSLHAVTHLEDNDGFVFGLLTASNEFVPCRRQLLREIENNLFARDVFDQMARNGRNAIPVFAKWLRDFESEGIVKFSRSEDGDSVEKHRKELGEYGEFRLTVRNLLSRPEKWQSRNDIMRLVSGAKAGDDRANRKLVLRALEEALHPATAPTSMVRQLADELVRNVRLRRYVLERQNVAETLIPVPILSVSARANEMVLSESVLVRYLALVAKYQRMMREEWAGDGIETSTLLDFVGVQRPADAAAERGFYQFVLSRMAEGDTVGGFGGVLAALSERDLFKTQIGAYKATQTKLNYSVELQEMFYRRISHDYTGPVRAIPSRFTDEGAVAETFVLDVWMILSFLAQRVLIVAMDDARSLFLDELGIRQRVISASGRLAPDDRVRILCVRDYTDWHLLAGTFEVGALQLRFESALPAGPLLAIVARPTAPYEEPSAPATPRGKKRKAEPPAGMRGGDGTPPADAPERVYDSSLLFYLRTQGRVPR